MIAEAIAKLQELFRATNPLVVVKPPAEPDHIYYLTDQEGGNIQRVEADPQPRRHTASDLSAIVAFAREFHGLDSADQDERNDVDVWYHRTGVVCLLDSQSRRDRITLPLAYSEPLKVLQNLDGKPCSFSQKEFVRLLKVNLANCVDGALISALCYLKFKATTDGESSIGHAKVSVGKSISAQVTGQKEFPEVIHVSVPIFHGFMHHATHAVACALEIEPTNERFSLTPLPGEIELCIRAAEDEIGQKLKADLEDSGITQIYYGVP